MSRAKQRKESYNKLIQKIEDYSNYYKVSEVNEFFNQFLYIKDPENTWKTREQFFEDVGGDCEDFCISKFHTLLDLGIGEDNLFLCHCILRDTQEHHMVLIYCNNMGDYPLVLDNYNKELLTLDARDDIVPVYSFNTKDAYLQEQSALGKKIPDVKNMKRLKEVL